MDQRPLLKSIEACRMSTNSDDLLKTIKLPLGAHNFYKIHERLPKANYEDQYERKQRYSSESGPRFLNLPKENNLGGQYVKENAPPSSMRKRNKQMLKPSPVSH